MVDSRFKCLPLLSVPDKPSSVYTAINGICLHRKVQQDRWLRQELLNSATHWPTMNMSKNFKRPSDEITIQEETFPAAEKILSDIENVIKRDSELTSFEIIPVQDNENKSPIYHEEHSLGLASWCVQPLYCYVYGRLRDQRRSDHRREESSTVSRWLMGGLLLNPDVSTFWNMKRELVRNGRLDALSELRFSTIVLFYKAKCFEAFAYRRWLVQYLLIDGGKSTSLDVESLLRNEINVARISADRYANNYHAWSHREYVLSTHEKNLPETYETLLKSEWDDSGKWCNRHISDHSGLAYRQFLLRRLLLQNKTEKIKDSVAREELEIRYEFVKEFVKSFAVSVTQSMHSWEFLNILHNTKTERQSDIDYDRTLVALSYWAEDCKNNENHILLFPGHEALWYHRRFLAYALIAINNSYRKYCRYNADSFLAGPAIKLEIGAAPAEIMKLKTERCLEKQREAVGLLILTFLKDNGRITSQPFKCQPQRTHGEKFVKYIREFNFDLLHNEERCTVG